MDKNFFRNYMVVFFFIISLVLLTGCGKKEDISTLKDKPRLIILAVDGASFDIINPMIKQGKLPSLKKLIMHGSTGTIKTVEPMKSPIIWTTVATGFPMKMHNIKNFIHEGTPVTSTLRNKPAFWNILSQHGLKSAVVGWLVTWPAEKKSGIIVSNRYEWADVPDSIIPKNIIDKTKISRREIRKKIPFQKITDIFADGAVFKRPKVYKDKKSHEYLTAYLIKKRIIDPFWRDELNIQIAESLLKEKDLDVLGVYMRILDYTGHGFWKFYEPQPFLKDGQKVDPEDIKKFKNVIPRAYEMVDRWVGRILNLKKENDTILLLSDHGMGPDLGKNRFTGKWFYLSGNHRPNGVFIISGKHTKKNLEQSRTIHFWDIIPTMYYMYGIPLFSDSPGKPLTQYFSETYQKNRHITYKDKQSTPSMAKPKVKRSQADKKILEELRSLGYIQ